MDVISMAYAKKLVNGLQSGLDNASVNNDTCSITFHWKNGTSSTMTFPKPLDGANGVGISDVKLKEVTAGSGKETHLICTLEDGTEIDAGNIPVGSGGITNYDDTQIKKDINEVNGKIEALKSTQSLEYKGESIICNNTLASRTSDMLIKGKTYINLGTGKLESAGEKEGKISILSNNNKSADDIDYKEYKKEISLPIDGDLKCLPNDVADTIEQRNDGVYLVQRVDKVVLNGSEAWTKSSWSMTNTFKFDFEIGLVAKLFDLNATNQILCDTFKVVSRNSLDNVANREFESICPSNSRSRTLSITISKTKLNNTNTTSAFKQWLSNNPVTVCYELATPVETKLDINNLDLEVYKDTTYVTTENAIQPTLKFKVPSNIGGVIQSNSQNINKLYKLSDEVIDKTDITTTIDNSSTDTQVPSAKSVWDNMKNKNTMQPSGTMAKYSTVFDWAVNNAGATCLYEGNNLADCPLKNTWGTLVCIGIKTENGLKVLACSNFNDNIYIRTILRRNGTNEWVEPKWQRICITNVEDMSPSEISSFVDTDVSGTVNYRVKNGICFVKLWGVKSTTTGAGKFLLNNSSMPIPSCFDTGNALFEANGDGTANAFAFVDTNGALIVHFYKANSLAYGTFSYPVKES